jgi:hypothetical protein
MDKWLRWPVGSPSWTTSATRLRGAVMPGADQLRGSRERDKLTIAAVCADLGISRRTFYEWRAKGTGRPLSWKRDEPSLTWYALTLDYAAYAKCISGQQAEAELRIEEATRPRQDP